MVYQMTNRTHIFLWDIARLVNVCHNIKLKKVWNLFLLDLSEINGQMKIKIRMGPQFSPLIKTVILWLYIWGLLPVVKLLRNQSDQWKFQPLAAVVRKGQNCIQSLREKKDKCVRCVVSDPGLLHMKYMKELLFELLFCMVLWVSRKKATCVFRKVTLLELLLWVQTVRGIQRLYILFIVCICIQPQCGVV